MPGSADTLLVSVDDLRSYDVGQAVAKIHSDDLFAERCLWAAQDWLGKELGFDPFVHAETFYVEAAPERRFLTADGYAYYYWPVARPAFAVADEGGTELAIGTGINAGRLIHRRGGNTATYYAGWRSTLHVLADPEGKEIALTSLPGLEDLEALPPEVPGDVFAFLCEAAVMFAQRIASGTIGIASVEQDMGQAVTRVTRLEHNALARLFDAYAKHYRPGHL